MIEVRLALAEDAALIAAISRETFYDTFGVHNTKADMDLFLAEQFSEAQLMKEVLLANHIFYLASDDAGAAGYVFLKQGSDAATGATLPIELSRLYVRNTFLGKGVGRLLMQTAIAHAQKSGNDVIWLGVWEHNRRAIDFYTAFGYEKFGEHDFILGKDVQRDWLMKRKVQQG